jgi:molybdopterin-binding protein
LNSIPGYPDLPIGSAPVKFDAKPVPLPEWHLLEREPERAKRLLYTLPGRCQAGRWTMSPDKLFTPREAAQVLGISYPTLKQWIYKKKIGAVQTAGGHHRIPEKEVDRFLYRSADKNEVAEKRTGFRRVSGRNQLVGRVIDIKLDGLIAQVTLSIGGQKITSIITSDAVREMRLKKGDTAAALIKSTEVMILRS